MGQFKHDGKATQGGMTFPAGTITYGDLYRLNGWNGIALKSIASGDTVRTADMEISSERVWYIDLPAGVNPAVGTYLYWTAGAGFKRGDTDLTVTPTGTAVAIVEEAPAAAGGFAAVRVLNVGP